MFLVQQHSRILLSGKTCAYRRQALSLDINYIQTIGTFTYAPLEGEESLGRTLYGVDACRIGMEEPHSFFPQAGNGKGVRHTT